LLIVKNYVKAARIDQPKFTFPFATQNIILYSSSRNKGDPFIFQHF